MKGLQIVGLRQLARNLGTGWLRLAVEVVIGLALTPFILAKLGPAAYGVWSLLNGLLGYLGLVDLGIRGSVGRYINHYVAREDVERTSEVVATSLAYLTGMGLASFGAAIVAGRYFTAIFPKSPPELSGPIAVALPLLAIGLWLTFITSVLGQMILSKDRFDAVNGVHTGLIILRAGAVIVSLRAGHGIVGLAGIIVGLGVIGCIATAIIAFRLNPEVQLRRRHVSRERFGEMWRFGIVTFFTRTANQIIYQTDSVLVMLFFGPTAVAVYGIAATLLQYGQRLVEQIGSTLFPSVTRAGSLKDMQGLRELFFLGGRLNFVVAILIYGGFIVFGGAFLALWVGPDFRAAATILTILSLAELASLLTSTGGTTLFSLDRLRFNLFSTIGEGLLNLGASIGFVFLLGRRMEGVALGTFVAATLVRGIALPIYSLAQIGVKAGEYYRSVGGRAGLLLLTTLALFAAIGLTEQHPGWALFSIQIGAATIAYLPLAIMILFGVRGLREVRERGLLLWRRWVGSAS